MVGPIVWNFACRVVFFKIGALMCVNAFHIKLNMCRKPIANKYREGKMKRTLEKELKDLKPLKRKR